jgi:hypothetical protein
MKDLCSSAAWWIIKGLATKAWKAKVSFAAWRILQYAYDVIAGESGLDAGAEGATAPETLRPMNRDDLVHSGKWRIRRPPTG